MIPLGRIAVIVLNRSLGIVVALTRTTSPRFAPFLASERFRITPKGRAPFGVWLRLSSVAGAKPRSAPRSSPCAKIRSVTTVRPKGIML
ncbi:MAG: hypothetical protein ABI898_02895 [Sphingomonadales bacterium]